MWRSVRPTMCPALPALVRVNVVLENPDQVGGGRDATRPLAAMTSESTLWLESAEPFVGDAGQFRDADGLSQWPGRRRALPAALPIL